MGKISRRNPFLFIIVSLAVVGMAGVLLGKYFFSPKEPTGINYVSGEILVVIKEGVTIGEVKNLFSGYGLQFESFYKTSDFENKQETQYDDDEKVGSQSAIFVVYVQKGDEKKWVEIFNKESIVKYSERHSFIWAL